MESLEDIKSLKHVKTSDTGEASIHKVAVASFIGTAIEWYDFFIFNAANALVFPALFFPKDDLLLGRLTLSGALFAVGFIARPIGGLVCGHFGDRIGRKHMLVVTLLLTGVSTFLIGLLPGRPDSGTSLWPEYYGPWVLFLLVVLRFAQGFGVGGEWGGAVLLAVERTSLGGKRGFYGSWPQVGVPIGLLSYAVFLLTILFGYDLRPDWWRLPFLLSIVLVGVGLWVRLSIPDSPLLEKLRPADRPKLPILTAWRRYPKATLQATGAKLVENLSFYIYTFFLLILADKFFKFERSLVLNSITLSALLMIPAIPFYGWVSDRVGRKPVYLFGAIFTGLFAFPFFWLFETGRPALVTLAVVLALVLGWAAMYAPQASFFSELFSTDVRYSGASFAAQVATVFAGGFAPLIAEGMVRGSGGTTPIAVYIIVMAVLTTAAVLSAPETYRDEMSDPPSSAPRM